MTANSNIKQYIFNNQQFKIILGIGLICAVFVVGF